MSRHYLGKAYLSTSEPDRASRLLGLRPPSRQDGTVRLLLTVIAALVGLLVVSGCDATDLTKTGHHHRLPYPTSAKATASPARSPHATRSPTAPTTPPATKHTPTGSTGAPKPTAVATNTSGGGSAGVPTSYAAAAARVAALGSAPHSSLTRFTTTGDSVYCVLRDPSIPTSCELRSGAIHDPGVCGQSMADAVGRIQLGDDGAVPECNSDTIREPGAHVVAAPAVVTSGSLECAVERIGVTCVNTRTKAGFFLTPGKYATFS